jgi:hypothetical protein
MAPHPPFSQPSSPTIPGRQDSSWRRACFGHAGARARGSADRSMRHRRRGGDVRRSAGSFSKGRVAPRREWNRLEKPLRDSSHRRTHQNPEHRCDSASLLGSFPGGEVHRLWKSPRRGSRTLHAYAGDAGLPVPMHVLQLPADVDHHLETAQFQARGR